MIVVQSVGWLASIDALRAAVPEPRVAWEASGVYSAWWDGAVWRFRVREVGAGGGALFDLAGVEGGRVVYEGPWEDVVGGTARIVGVQLAGELGTWYTWEFGGCYAVRVGPWSWSTRWARRRG